MRLMVLISVLSLLAPACKKDPDSADSPAGTRRQQCQLLVKQSMAAAVLILVGLEGELSEEGSGTAKMIECAKRHRDDPTQCLVLEVEDALELRQKRDELLAECLTWPEQVFECMRRGDETSPECLAAISSITGRSAQVDRSDVPAGPEVAWTLSLPGKPRLTRLMPDGTVIVRIEKKLMGIRQGKRLWQSEFEAGYWALGLDDGSLLTGDDQGGLLNLDAASGKLRWKLELPDHLESDEYFRRKARAVAAAREGANVVVATNDARFFRLDPRRCQKSPQGCMKQAHRLTDEALDYDTILLIGRDGTRYMKETGVVRVFTPGMREIFAIRARDLIGDMRPMPGRRLALTVDDRLVVLEVASCRSQKPFALPAKKGGEFDECRECVDPPAGCIATELRLPGATWVEHEPVDRDSLVMTVEEETRLVRTGKVVWKTNVGATGYLAVRNDTVYAVTFGYEEKDPMAVWAISLTDGKSLWRTEVKTAPRDVSFMSDALVLYRGEWLLAMADNHLAVVRIGKAK